MPHSEIIDDTLYIKDDSKFARTLCFVQFCVINSVLHIINIETTSFGLNYKNAHFGTTILNMLLIHLHTHNIFFSSIVGRLSYQDAYNNNWNKSIFFYYDFPKWLDKNLPYSLTFNLYKDKDFNNLIQFDNLRPTEIEIQHLINESVKLKIDAFFVFNVYR